MNFPALRYVNPIRNVTSNMQKLILSLLVFMLTTCFLASQEKKATISQLEKTQVIDSLSLHMEKDYVLDKIGHDIAELLRQNLKTGQYDKFPDPRTFAEQLTTDIRSLNNDKHLRVYYEPEQIKLEKEAANDDKEAQEAILKKQRMANYGFKEVQIMPGNVGYLKFNSFDGTTEGLKTAIGAMAFLANCDALIFDIRENGGGDPRMVQLILSYLYMENEDVHINDFYVRKTDDYQQYWVMPYCPGTRMPDLDVYVLTSSYTFSCAEEFAYDLQNLKRGTIVGETTGGGAHPVQFFVLNDNFEAMIPFGRAVNPVSKTNWEGTGVEPDVKVKVEQALDTAYQLALQKLMEKEKDENFKFTYEWAIDGLRKSSKPVKLNEKLMKSYVGVYEVRTITLENGDLYYQREGRDKLKMIPLTDDYFWFKEVDYFRLKVIVKDGKAVKLEGHYDDGRIDFSERTK